MAVPTEAAISNRRDAEQWSDFALLKTGRLEHGKSTTVNSLVLQAVRNEIHIKNKCMFYLLKCFISGSLIYITTLQSHGGKTFYPKCVNAIGRLSAY